MYVKYNLHKKRKNTGSFIFRDLQNGIYMIQFGELSWCAGTALVVMGDFNATIHQKDRPKSSTTKISVPLQTLINGMNLIDTFWVTNGNTIDFTIHNSTGGAFRIDLITVQEKDRGRVIEAKIIPYPSSDHDLVHTILGASPKREIYPKSTYVEVGYLPT